MCLPVLNGRFQRRNALPCIKRGEVVDFNVLIHDAGSGEFERLAKMGAVVRNDRALTEVQ